MIDKTMKHVLMGKLMLFCFLWPVAVSALNREVEYPVYDKRTSEALEIEKIVVNDTATILSVDVYSRPGYWIALSSRTVLKGKETGKTYRLLRSDGFALDTKVPMPESGNVFFTLEFETLDDSDWHIDFIEGEAAGDFRIEGLSLDISSRKSSIHTHLKGKVIDRPQTSRLMLLVSGKNPVTTSWVSVPVRNGMFDYHFYTDEERAYDLICWEDFLNGSIPYCVFFSEPGEVDFLIYPSEHTPFSDIKTKNPLTQEHLCYMEQRDAVFLPEWEELERLHSQLEADSCLYTQTYYDFWIRFEKEKDLFKKNRLYAERDSLEACGAFYTSRCLQWREEYAQLMRKINEWECAYWDKHPSIVGLYWIRKHIGKDINAEAAEKLFFSRYASLYPGHSITAEIRMLMEGVKLVPGAKYLDVTATDLEGKPVNVNAYILGKIALVDLWASWCGPCRRNSIQMIPVYEKYKEKGFTVIGIAREQGSVAAMEEAIRKDGYPWVNLVELNDRNGIWMRHNLNNVAGGTFLIDRDGTILAVSPNADEVERILQTKL